MKRIVVQMGHINVRYNSIVNLRTSTGAPGEQIVNKNVADRVSELCRQRGIEVVQTDANANDDKNITPKDWDLFLALHCDADYPNDNGSGFATFPAPATDGATKESQRIAGIFNDVYFKETTINYKDHSNDNTKYYYMWKYLTAKTPCVLIEMGQVQDPRDKVLLGNTELIATAIVRAICKAFAIAYDLTPQVPPVVVQPPKPTTITDLKTKVDLGTPYGVKTLTEFKNLLIKIDGDNQTLIDNNRKMVEVNATLGAKINNIKVIINK